MFCNVEEVTINGCILMIFNQDHLFLWVHVRKYIMSLKSFVMRD